MDGMTTTIIVGLLVFGLLVLVFIVLSFRDLDNFKSYNNRHGRHEGDQIPIFVVDRTRKVIEEHPFSFPR